MSDKVFIQHYDSPLGRILLGSDGTALTGLWFDGQKYAPDTSGTACAQKNLSVFQQACRWLDLYFQGRDPGFTPPLALQGTDFQKMVWQILETIPYGQTLTYGQIAGLVAEKTGRKQMSAQAIGGAVGHNPISLIIPCHRVIGAQGQLTGYAGGLDRKKKLLCLEQTGRIET